MKEGVVEFIVMCGILLGLSVFAFHQIPNDPIADLIIAQSVK